MTMEKSITGGGVVQYGNFKNYYNFNTAEQRILRLLESPIHVWKLEQKPYLVLDVGCNSGNLTAKIHAFLETKVDCIFTLGVDIDNCLIKKACDLTNEKNNLIFKCIDIMNANELKFMNDLLKKYNKSKFDAVFCLSITMWIHLNHHDDGLQNFLKYICSISNLLILEPQPWKCYKAALRRTKRAKLNFFPNFELLKWRVNIENEIDNYLQNDLKRIKIYSTKPTKWSRKLFFYH